MTTRYPKPVGGIQKKVHQAVTAFQIARSTFVHAAEAILSQGSGTGEALEAFIEYDVLSLLCCPLAQDPVLSIRANSIDTLSQLAARNDIIASEVAQSGALDSLVCTAFNENHQAACAALDALAALCGTSSDRSLRVVQAGAVDAIKDQFGQDAMKTKVCALKALDKLVVSSATIAESIMDEAILKGFVEHLNLPLTPERVELFAILAKIIGNLAAYTPQIAQKLLDSGAIDGMLRLKLKLAPPSLKSAVFKSACLVVARGGEFAEIVGAKYDIVQAAIKATIDPLEPNMRRNAMALLHEIAKQSKELAELEKGNSNELPAILTLGHIARINHEMCKTMTGSGGCPSIIAAVRNPDANVVKAGGWTIEQIGVHGEDVVLPLIEADGINTLVEAYARSTNTHGEKDQLKRGLKTMIRNCGLSAHLQPHIDEGLPIEILKPIVKRLLEILVDCVDSRKDFVISGALGRLQKLIPRMDHRATGLASQVNKLFPDDVLLYYS
ncbi:hypothetical protein BSKO_00806 [Bryopsis sp. KO-2023]|nr:hypothetical protein BSKO_00806 [Bryopsis sp. KO-2023]